MERVAKHRLRSVHMLRGACMHAQAYECAHAEGHMHAQA